MRQYPQRTLCNKRQSALDGVTCDLPGEAAAVRVGAGLKTSDKGVYAKGIVVVLNREQGLEGIVADGRRGGGS
jgi:hypothetical protein